MRQLRLVDSITELVPHDVDCIAVSGSHGGISSAQYALAARPFLNIFNDAGVGKDHAGRAALDFLQNHDLAACTVALTSGCIGQAQSTLEDGLISATNTNAQALGIQLGLPCKQTVDLLLVKRKS